MSYDTLTGADGRLPGRDYKDPVPPELDEDLVTIDVAKELGIPVTHLGEMPAHLVSAVHVRMAWRRIEAESERARAEQRATAETARRAPRRR